MQKINAQVVYESMNNKGIYAFLDELATEQIISLNSCAKPFSRELIFSKLTQAQSKLSDLNKRQQDELTKYISDFSMESNVDVPIQKATLLKTHRIMLNFSPISLQYTDFLFKIFIQPVIGRSYIIRDDKQYTYDNKVGASFFAYMGKNIGVYASLTDHYLYKSVFPMPDQLLQMQGGNYKINNGSRAGADYSEMVGGINYSWKWGSFGVVKDNIMWGDNANGSNIFSGRTPSFGMIKLALSPAKWIDFNYLHGWIPSMVVDSARSYVSPNGVQRNIYRNKYIAANMISIKPFQNFYFSFGNSIIYSDKSIQIAYLIPFMFYKSIDHSLTMGVENENSQMFFNISSRNIKHVHLYASYFIDEWSFKRINDKTKHNFTSGKAGLNIQNFPFQNLSFCFEYTKTLPLTYKHRLESTTFASNNYNFGHYLGDNSEDIFASLNYKPFSFLKIQVSGNIAKKGNDYDYIIIPGQNIDSYPIMKDITWTKREIYTRIDFILSRNVFINLGFQHSQIKGYDVDSKTAIEYLTKFSPLFFHGIQNFYFFGVNLGF